MVTCCSVTYVHVIYVSLQEVSYCCSVTHMDIQLIADICVGMDLELHVDTESNTSLSVTDIGVWTYDLEDALLGGSVDRRLHSSEGGIRDAFLMPFDLKAWRLKT